MLGLALDICVYSCRGVVLESFELFLSRWLPTLRSRVYISWGGSPTATFPEEEPLPDSCICLHGSRFWYLPCSALAFAQYRACICVYLSVLWFRLPTTKQNYVYKLTICPSTTHGHNNKWKAAPSASLTHVH